MRAKKKVYKVLGWREHFSLPDWGIEQIKAKIDSGAKTSALHAKNIRFYESHNLKKKKMLSFDVYPEQGNNIDFVHVRSELLDMRWVKSSSGHKSLRPLVRVYVKLGEDYWPIKLTLVDRDMMGFRMLIGREALRNKFLINPSRSFLFHQSHDKK